jgi:hypothetical protein
LLAAWFALHLICFALLALHKQHQP